MNNKIPIFEYTKQKNMRFIAIIPARYASTRFPGKPLAIINNKPMIQLVYEQCLKVFEHVIVATDDQRIAGAVKIFNGEVVMTNENHPSGTDRVAEAAQLLSEKYDFDVVVNVQGDEPFVEPDQLKQIQKCFDDETTDIATLVTPIEKPEILFDPNKVKAVLGIEGDTLYFSRQPVPYLRDYPESEWYLQHDYFLHMGLYAYKANVLDAITKLKQTPLEKAEKLEQLRWLENGFKIKAAITSHANFGIDTPQDLEKVSNTR